VYEEKARAVLSAETWSTPLIVRAGAVRVVAAARDGTVLGLDGALQEQWRLPLGAAVTASPNADGLVLVGTHAGRLVALDPETGRVAWERAFGREIRASASFARIDGRALAFVAAYGDRVVALDATTGETAWSRWLPPSVWIGKHGIVSSPAIVTLGGAPRVLVGNRAFRIYALDAATGRLAWWRRLRYGVDSTACQAGDTALLGTGEALNGRGDNRVVAVDAAGGITWGVPIGAGVDACVAAATVDGAAMAFAATLGPGELVGIRSGREAWRVPLGPTPGCEHTPGCHPPGVAYDTAGAVCRSYTTPCVGDLDGDGRVEVAVGSNNGRVFVVDAASGSVRATLELGGPVRGSLVYGDIDDDGAAELIVAAGATVVALATAGTGRWAGFNGGGPLNGTGVAVDAASAPARRSLRAEAELLADWTLRDGARRALTLADKAAERAVGRPFMDFRY